MTSGRDSSKILPWPTGWETMLLTERNTWQRERRLKNEGNVCDKESVLYLGNIACARLLICFFVFIETRLAIIQWSNEIGFSSIDFNTQYDGQLLSPMNWFAVGVVVAVLDKHVQARVTCYWTGKLVRNKRLPRTEPEVPQQSGRWYRDFCKETKLVKQAELLYIFIFEVKHKLQK